MQEGKAVNFSQQALGATGTCTGTLQNALQHALEQGEQRALPAKSHLPPDLQGSGFRRQQGGNSG